MNTIVACSLSFLAGVVVAFWLAAMRYHDVRIVQTQLINTLMRRIDVLEMRLERKIK